MKTETQLISIIPTQEKASEIYEVISREVLTNCIKRKIIISGSLLTLTKFKNVTFVGCVVFGTKFSECEFSGCTFKDCKFQFSDIRNCNFVSTVFENCTWDNTYMEQSIFDSCRLDFKTLGKLSKGDNIISNCFGDVFPGLSKDLMAA